ncbi:hypothetical protein [Alkalihalobacterium alkalinitrilicum]|uniref:hypothetical protein n=1 Tax=Alkalihalobacterium alkalinitrilicum TaxID=427920 RepID=UPI000994CB79|nr:hypothetical protein [Alkalihalobacterium alkalinitrilicum]
MLLLFPSWLFIVVGLLLVGILCACLSIFISKWMKKKNIIDKRIENVAAFLIVIVVFASAMFIKENMFTSVYEGSLIVTEDGIVEVPYSSAEFLTLNDVIIIDYLFAQVNYGENFQMNNKENENVRVTVAINDFRPLLTYMKKYEQEGIEGYVQHHFPFDIYFEREHFEKVKQVIEGVDSTQSCENLLPSLKQELAQMEKDYYEYEVTCVK